VASYDETRDDHSGRVIALATATKKVNHEMPAERFPSSLAPRYRAHFVSAANWTRVRVKNRRKMATKSTLPKAQKQPRYQYIRWLGRQDSNLGMAESKIARTI
jgi:hypothetical protein